MASPAATLPPDREPVPPPPDPQAIRACLTPDVAAAFDAEWEFVLDEAKQAKDPRWPPARLQRAASRVRR
jgi:hypothetical protein